MTRAEQAKQLADRLRAHLDQLEALAAEGDPAPGHAKVILFKDSGKYYTEEEWRIPEGAIGPADMRRSPDFRRISGRGAVLVTGEPWGYPHLIPGES